MHVTVAAPRASAQKTPADQADLALNIFPVCTPLEQSAGRRAASGLRPRQAAQAVPQGPGEQVDRLVEAALVALDPLAGRRLEQADDPAGQQALGGSPAPGV